MLTDSDPNTYWQAPATFIQYLATVNLATVFWNVWSCHLCASTKNHSIRPCFHPLKGNIQSPAPSFAANKSRKQAAPTTLEQSERKKPKARICSKQSQQTSSSYYSRTKQKGRNQSYRIGQRSPAFQAAIISSKWGIDNDTHLFNSEQFNNYVHVL